MVTAPIASLWTWPWTLFEANMAAAETLVAAQTVVQARLPLVWSALLNPWFADHRELSLMVTEKVQAFGVSHRVVEGARRKVATVVDANARDLGRWSGGTPIWPTAWWRMAERNLDLFATLMSMTGRAIAPIHATATANAVRLRA